MVYILLNVQVLETILSISVLSAYMGEEPREDSLACHEVTDSCLIDPAGL